MTEYTATFVRELVEGLEPSEITAPSEEDFRVAVDTLEGLEGLLTHLPADVRREAMSGTAIERDGAQWIPTTRNCRLSVGVAIEQDGLISFAVGDESSADGPLDSYFSARVAVAHALHGSKGRIVETGPVSANQTLTIHGCPSTVQRDASLVEAIKAAGWALPAARRADDLDAEILARIARLSERGIVHLFAEGGGWCWRWPAPPPPIGRRRSSGSRSRLRVPSPPGAFSVSS